MKKKINIIGHLGSSSGLGNTARLFIAVLHSQGYELAGLDVDYHAGGDATALPNIRMAKSVAELPFEVNLIIVAIQLLPSIWRRRLPGLLAPRFKNVGLIFWELPVIPSPWLPSLRMFDAIMVCSQYVRHTLETALPEIRTVFAEHPLQTQNISLDGSDVRNTLGLKQTDLVYASSFDLRSDYTRKNPLAVLDAFEAAFPNESDVRLVIKANGKPDDGGSNPVAQQILKRVVADPRIVFISETMPYERVMKVYAACDVYLSLHRAEGLGLGPMEAMLLGKLVIATGYSGNMTYMTQQNSMPIPYGLTAPTHTSWQYQRAFSGKGAAWAEPDMHAAVAALRLAYEKPELRKRLAQAARMDIARRQETAWSASYQDELARCLSEEHHSKRRQHLRRHVTINEILDPTLRKLNLKTLILKVSRKST